MKSSYKHGVVNAPIITL